jgi:Ser/Thr protein kinase RdoA (MazF antagonist)
VDAMILKNWDLGEIIDIRTDNRTSVKKYSINYIKTSESIYILKRLEYKIKMERHVYISKYLSENTGLVKSPILTKKGSTYLTNDGKFYCLYEMIQGRSYFERMEIGFRERFIKYGQYIGDLHNLLDFKSDKDIFSYNDISMKVKNWALPIIKGFSESNKEQNLVKRLFSSEDSSKGYLINLEDDLKKLPKQLIHRDLNLNNLIFKENELAGIIDFEMVEYNTRLFDMAYFLSSITGNLDLNRVEKSDYISAVKSLVLGYNLVSNLTDIEKNALLNILKASELIFIAWFIKKGRLDLIENKLKVVEWLNNGYIL